MRGAFRTRLHESVNQKPIWYRFSLIHQPKNQIPLRGLVSGGFWLVRGYHPLIHKKMAGKHEPTQHFFCNSSTTPSRCIEQGSRNQSNGVLFGKLNCPRAEMLPQRLGPHFLVTARQWPTLSLRE